MYFVANLGLIFIYGPTFPTHFPTRTMGFHRTSWDDSIIDMETPAFSPIAGYNPSTPHNRQGQDLPASTLCGRFSTHVLLTPIVSQWSHQCNPPHVAKRRREQSAGRDVAREDGSDRVGIQPNFCNPGPARKWCRVSFHFKSMWTPPFSRLLSKSS